MLIIYVGNRSLREMIQRWLQTKKWNDDVLLPSSIIAFEDEIERQKRTLPEVVVVIDAYTETDLDRHFYSANFFSLVNRLRQSSNVHVIYNMNKNQKLPPNVSFDGKIPFDNLGDKIYKFIETYINNNNDLAATFQHLNWL